MPVDFTLIFTHRPDASTDSEAVSAACTAQANESSNMAILRNIFFDCIEVGRGSYLKVAEKLRHLQTI